MQKRREFLAKITQLSLFTGFLGSFSILEAKSHKEQKMQKPQHILVKGKIGEMQERFGYTSAVRIGNIVEISGQGGWDRDFNFIHKDLLDEVNQAFENVEYVLQSSGTSWKNVYSVHSYFTQPISEEVNNFMAHQFKSRCANPPLWTCLQVARLGDKRMRVEIEVKVYIG